MSLSIRQAHNVLAQIAHAALLNGDQRNIVNEANNVMVGFIEKYEPVPAAVDKAIADAAASVKRTGNAAAGLPTGAPKLDLEPPDHVRKAKK